ncbi:hypothetical protein L6452_30510 [Arctium lappa]|uniref:Uncharacterized protein n=1 Tax=Arctium lappa TaxID=4217 RepID=A0ACB8ZJI3_ARCLA|nr:hypothetical protein L6452_30510 [Arctium lappa]
MNICNKKAYPDEIFSKSSSPITATTCRQSPPPQPPPILLTTIQNYIGKRKCSKAYQDPASPSPSHCAIKDLRYN